MHIVQQALSPVTNTREVLYTAPSGTEADLKLAVGYVVCWDIGQPLTPATGTFDEMVLGRVVIKPATANLNYFAGVVTSLGKRLYRDSTTEWSQFCTLWTPGHRDISEAWTKANMTAETTLLGPVNASWYLGVATLYAVAAMAMQTHDSSSTAAVKKVRWVDGGGPAVS